MVVVVVVRQLLARPCVVPCSIQSSTTLRASFAILRRPQPALLRWHWHSVLSQLMVVAVGAEVETARIIVVVRGACSPDDDENVSTVTVLGLQHRVLCKGKDKVVAVCVDVYHKDVHVHGVPLRNLGPQSAVRCCWTSC